MSNYKKNLILVEANEDKEAKTPPMQIECQGKNELLP
jgi:hypothetical protein